GGELGHQEERRSARNQRFFPNSSLLRPVLSPLLELHKVEGKTTVGQRLVVCKCSSIQSFVACLWLGDGH
ncbi:hypothetical protein Taro_012199, partial [Colocasia esculenta]|nr:hypothetical protein [Colocasia esculenta]